MLHASKIVNHLFACLLKSSDSIPSRRSPAYLDLSTLSTISAILFLVENLWLPFILEVSIVTYLRCILQLGAAGMLDVGAKNCMIYI